MKDIPNYVMKITDADAEGKKQLNNFILPDDTPYLTYYQKFH